MKVSNWLLVHTTTPTKISTRCIRNGNGNCVFWPSDPFTPANRKCKVFDLQNQRLDVIFHHETVSS
jgi:hypothetical protein